VTLMRLSLGAKKLKYLKKSYKLFCTFYFKKYSNIWIPLCNLPYSWTQQIWCFYGCDIFLMIFLIVVKISSVGISQLFLPNVGRFLMSLCLFP
jgi:hypothetical protein